MRLVRDAVLAAALFGCRPTASPPPPGRFTLLFFGRSPAASLGGLSWAPDPEHGRLVAFDRELRVTRQITHPRLATPVAVTPLGRTELLVTERTGEGVVVDTAGGGRVVREWESPDIASLYAAGAGRVAATRSPYYVPQLGSPEPDTAPLIRMLDTLGRPTGGLATIRRPATPLLDYLVNAGAVAVGPYGSVYFAPTLLDHEARAVPRRERARSRVPPRHRHRAVAQTGARERRAGARALPRRSVVCARRRRLRRHPAARGCARPSDRRDPHDPAPRAPRDGGGAGRERRARRVRCGFAGRRLRRRRAR